jgi:hypothetical protein
MTFPYGRMRMVCSLRPPFDAMAGHEVVVPRVGLWAERKADRRRAVRREIESTRRHGVPRLANAGEGRAADADSRGRPRKESRG